MDRTDFAGLTRLAPSDPLSTDGYSFQRRNPTIIDHFLRLIVTHRHDAHLRLADPTTDPAVAVVNAGGTIPSDTEITVGYTLLDQDDGETLLNTNTQVVTTQAGLADPTSMPVLALDTTAGALLANSYTYAVTITDGAGGETILGTPASIDVPSGSATAQVHISGLSSIPAEVGGVGWRLWRSVGGGSYALIASSASGLTDAVTDNGTLPVDCGVSPPSVTGSSKATSLLHVTVPGGQPAGAVQFRIYASLDGTFADPCLLGTYPIADTGAQKTYTALAFLAGSPPEVATTVPGSTLIAGGGGGGVLALMRPGTDAPGVANSVIWHDPTDPDTPDAIRLTGVVEDLDASGGLTLDSNHYHGGEYNPAPSLFDSAQPPNDFGGVPSYLVPKAATSQAEWHGGIAQKVAMIGEGWIVGDFKIETIAAGWDILGVGWGAGNPLDRTGVFAILDRASGQLRLVYRAAPADALTVLGSAAFSGIADGSQISVRLQRHNASPVGSGHDLTATLHSGKADIATVTYQTNVLVGGSRFGHLVAGWTDPASFKVDQVMMTRTGKRRKLEVAVTEIGRSAESRLVLDDAGRAWPFDQVDNTIPARQAADRISAAGAASGLSRVVKTGVGTYDVEFPVVLDGAPVVMVNPQAGATITNESRLGFSVAYAADTAFSYIAVAAGA